MKSPLLKFCFILFYVYTQDFLGSIRFFVSSSTWLKRLLFRITPLSLPFIPLITLNLWTLTQICVGVRYSGRQTSQMNV